MYIVDFETKTITADNHVVETYRTCEEKFRLSLQDHWRPGSGAPALGFGIAMHAARAQYKKLQMMQGLGALGIVDDAVRAGLAVWDAEMPADMKTDVMEDDKRGRRNFERLARGYFEKYGGAEFEPVQVEVPGKQFLGVTPEGWKFDYVYTIDEVVRHRDELYPLEFKTASGFGPPDSHFFSQFNNKSSVTGYIWAVEKHFGYAVKGAIIQAMWVHSEPKPGSRSKYTLPDYFKMDYSYRDQAQVDEWIHNTLLTGDDIVRSVREGRYKRADGMACSIYNGCSFKKICEATPEIRGRLLEIDYVKNEWNPWARSEGEG